LELLEAIKGRRSIRAFKPDKIPPEVIKKLVDSARWAPSAGNLQPWEFIVVTEEEKKQDLAKAALGQQFIAEASAVIVVCANVWRSGAVYGLRGETLYCIQDTAAATQNILLTAYAMGYGTCWVGAFNEEAVRAIVNVPRKVRPVALIPVGKPREKPAPPPRRAVDEILYWESYQGV